MLFYTTDVVCRGVRLFPPSSWSCHPSFCCSSFLSFFMWFPPPLLLLVIVSALLLLIVSHFLLIPLHLFLISPHLFLISALRVISPSSLVMLFPSCPPHRCIVPTSSLAHLVALHLVVGVHIVLGGLRYHCSTLRCVDWPYARIIVGLHT